MVFIGDKVSAGKAPEVLEVIRFLDRVCRDTPWAVGLAARVLGADSGLTRPDGADLFADRLPYLASLNLSPARVVADLRRDLFLADADADSGLSLHLIKSADGEIGIRARAGAADAYCGVINVGDASNLLKRVAEQTEIPTDEDDSISPSLFKGLDSGDSNLSFLVGSKKFLEGWSSWRVSAMGRLAVVQSSRPQDPATAATSDPSRASTSSCGRCASSACRSGDDRHSSRARAASATGARGGLTVR